MNVVLILTAFAYLTMLPKPDNPVGPKWDEHSLY